MRRKCRALAITLAFMLTAAMCGCENTQPSGGDTWASGVTFQMTLQPLTDQEKENLQSALAPEGEEFSFTDAGKGPGVGPDIGFAYVNLNLSDEQKAEPVASKEEAVDMAESALRAIDMLPAEGKYGVEVLKDYVSGNEYGRVIFYYQFHNIPVYMKLTSDIEVGVCKDGVANIRYYSRYTMETVEQPDTAPNYISESEAIESCRKKLEETEGGSTVEVEEKGLTRIYVYTAGKAVPMYMVDAEGANDINTLFVDAVSGEVTDYPWEASDSEYHLETTSLY